VRSLYVRIWLTVVAALALFALASGWLVQRHLQQERQRVAEVMQGRAEAWADLIQRSLPPADAPRDEQAAALREWSQRLRLPLALDDARGGGTGVTEGYLRHEAGPAAPQRRGVSVRLDDGRTLWIARPLGMLRRAPPAEGGGPGPEFGRGIAPGGGPHMGSGMGPAMGQGMGPGMGPGLRPHDGAAPPFERRLFSPPGVPEGFGIVLLLALLFLAVAAGAYPVVRRLTRRLEALKQGVEAFGAGALDHRVAADGRDEVAAVAASFNRAAGRIEALVRSHQSLLANASHELRSPLARLKMAVAMLEDAPEPRREPLRAEIHADIAELDALVDEVLLASRLDAAREALQRQPVELLAIAAEEGARVGAQVQGSAATVQGDERLLRRALRNLLENARRYGGGTVEVEVAPQPAGGATVRVCDRGPGVPEACRERIFEPFFRLPGHAEREGGVGLGLSLVRQIATRHGGGVRCEARAGGGSCFTLQL
jgi:signal transduction histidine kinase